MGRITDLFPALYHKGNDDLIKFVEQLEPSLDDIEKKIRKLPDLIDVDKCPVEFLSYLAAQINCPLVGDNPRLWRRQIRNWPWLLKYKGTERSLEIFLRSIGFDEFVMRTWFRDAQGSYVEEKPKGEPFYSPGTGLWHNSRTHYFSLEVKTDYLYEPWQNWSENFWEKILPWLERAKPFHAELLNVEINIIPPDIGLPEDHICRYDYCLYSHGYWPRPVDHWNRTEEENPLVFGCRYREEIRRLVYLLAPMYGASRYDDIFDACWRSFALREHMAYTHMTDRIKIRWKRRWLDGGKWVGNWADDLCRWESIRNRAKIWTFPFALGVYSEGEPLGSLNCCYSPRHRHMESPGAYGSAKYGDLVGPTEWMPIYRFCVRSIPVLGQRAPTPGTSLWGIVRSYAGSVGAPEYTSLNLSGGGHPRESLRYDGRRSWCGRWSGKWRDVDEATFRTRKITVLREDE